MGEMGRRIWNSGFSVTKAPCTQPIHSPSGMANNTAIPKPAATRNSEAPMCSHNVPSFASSMVPVTTCHGVGKITLLVATTSAHHSATTTAITTIDGSEDLRPFIFYQPSPAPLPPLPRAPADLLPGPHGLRLDDDRHLSTGMGSAIECVIRGFLERQAETLPGHHDGRAEHLRHLVEIAQQQYVVESEGQADPRGQYVHLVAGHAPRISALRYFESLLVRG